MRAEDKDNLTALVTRWNSVCPENMRRQLRTSCSEEALRVLSAALALCQESMSGQKAWDEDFEVWELTSEFIEMLDELWMAAAK